MCGFSLVCSESASELPGELVDELKRRGPHSYMSLHRTLIRDRQDEPDLQLYFTSTVLSLRGDSVVQQPLVDELSGSMLCWNGEAWRLGSDMVYGNDSQLVFYNLLKCTQNLGGTWLENKDFSAMSIRRVVGAISGPFSFLFYDATFARIFYGRDILGRRSLLLRQSLGGTLTIASISNGFSSGPWQEVDSGYIYDLDFSVGTLNSYERGSDDMKTISVESRRNWFTIRCTPWAAIRAVFPDINRETVPQSNLPLNALSQPIVDLQEELCKSLATRVTGVPTSDVSSVEAVRVAILFSGGLDCTLLARLCHDIIPCNEAIDLLNVAFENPRIMLAAKSRQTETPISPFSAYDLCPDRITGLSSHAELARNCPGRRWNFVCINVPYEETKAHRETVIRLMYPHDTEMDLSISLALYFASRGRGITLSPPNSKEYVSSALVLLSGLGADELFGGYGRHRVAFSKRGPEGLLDELELDFGRISKRNLGRDDRVISHWGKEARYPYLDEDFVSWVLKRPVWEKCDFMRRQGHQDHAGPEPTDSMISPEKSSLRLLAWKLGMQGAAQEKKRAIQFGARTAKMVTGRVKGTQILGEERSLD